MASTTTQGPLPGQSFTGALRAAGHSFLESDRVSWLQVNVGKQCNQACHHCHVDAGPQRTERMTRATAERVVSLLEASPGIELVDITGGAPELNPNFRYLVESAYAYGARIVDRCNLTILLEPGHEDLLDFLVQHRVELVASLPCYLRHNVDRQRGRGVFDRSIQALEALNLAGYGVPGSGLSLDLVYNPTGPSLPPSQASLEATYRQQLAERFGLQFSRLLTITNMPISRFLHDLERSGDTQRYMNLLGEAFNPGTLDGLMCRQLVSVGWNGSLHDCDFNQMLDLELSGDHAGQTIWDIGDFRQLDQRPVTTARHCFGCTAGAGSGCSGAID